MMTTSADQVAPDEVVICRLGDRTYAVPRECSVAISSQNLGRKGRRSSGRPRWDDHLFYVSATVRVVDGRPMILRASVQAERGLVPPAAMAAIPWAEVAEHALIKNATSEPEMRRRVAEQRRKDLAAAAGRVQYRNMFPKQERRPVTNEVLRRVLELRAEAEHAGVPYGPYVAEGLGAGYSVRWARDLARLAAKRKAKGEL